MDIARFPEVLSAEDLFTFLSEKRFPLPMVTSLTMRVRAIKGRA